MMLLSVDCFRKNRPNDVEIPFLGDGGQFQARFIRLADLRGNIQTHAEADETFPRVKSQQRAVLQQLMANPDPTVQAALREPANLGFIKSLIGLGELVVPGEDARNKQLREIQQLLAAAPIAVSKPGNAILLHGVTQTANREIGAPRQAIPGAPDAIHLVSTVPVDELLDDHASEFEECRRWASSDAGQLARAQNPVGFANVRAHAAEHAAALARQQATLAASTPPPRLNPSGRLGSSRTTCQPGELRTYATDATESDNSGDDESQGSPSSTAPQPRQTPQSLAPQIPADVRAEMARAIDDSNRPTGDPKNPTPQDDKKGGFHEEYGAAGLDASGKWVVSRDKPGPYGNPDVTTHLSPSREPADQNVANSVVDHSSVFPRASGQARRIRTGWTQPPSDADKAGASQVEKGSTNTNPINIVFAA